MSKQSTNDNNLTTDAMPSPPRDEPPRNKSDEEDFINSQKSNSRPRPPTYKMGYGKTRKVSPTAFATVINISGSNGVHIGSNCNIYMNKPTAEQQPKPDEKLPTITPEMQKLLDSSTPLNRDHIVAVAPHIKQWQHIARGLHYSEGQIDHFHLDHCEKGVKEVIIQFLVDWMRNADDASVGKLAHALLDHDQEDVLRRWSKVFAD